MRSCLEFVALRLWVHARPIFPGLWMCANPGQKIIVCSVIMDQTDPLLEARSAKNGKVSTIMHFQEREGLLKGHQIWAQQTCKCQDLLREKLTQMEDNKHTDALATQCNHYHSTETVLRESDHYLYACDFILRHPVLLFIKDCPSYKLVWHILVCNGILSHGLRSMNHVC